MKNPYLHKIVTEIAQELECGMKCFLNLDTGEVESIPQEPLNDDELFLPIIEKVNAWKNSLSFEPISSQEAYEMMEDFINENTREGSALHARLSNAINRRKPFANFKLELERCDGLEHWYKFKSRCYEAIVVNQIVDEVGRDKVNIYKLNQETKHLIALARIAGRYCYIDNTNRRVIISRVKEQPTFKIVDDECIELETNYTLMEQIIRKAEEKEFYRYGGGLVIEPCDPEEESPEEMKYENIIKSLDSSIMWIDAEQKQYDDFCRSQKAIDALYEELGIDVMPAQPFSPKEEIRYDGKYPVPGKPDDCFTDDDPWGNGPY